MVSSKTTKLIIAAIAILLASSSNLVFASADFSSQTCTNVKKTLKTIQKNDTKTRTTIGPIYEKLQTKFIKPFNVRLVNNSLSISELITIQAEYASKRADFYQDFTSYSQSLEEMLALDCKNNLDLFSAKLTAVRTKREKVRDDVDELNQLISEYRGGIIILEESL